MHKRHQPASRAFTAALLGILRKTEKLLERRVATDQAIQGLDVTESTWDVWEQTCAAHAYSSGVVQPVR